MPNDSNAIKLDGITKSFLVYRNPMDRLLEIISGGRAKRAIHKLALDGIDLEVKIGDRLGIVGENGAGKSTLLKIISKVLVPSKGNIFIQGKVSSLLELGAGFNTDLTGLENIKQFCVLHGLSNDEIKLAIPKIADFTELGSELYNLVKTYSTGMTMRLGFACAVYVKPDILIVDEALSVGDTYFQNKCLQKIKSMLRDNVTFIYVSHAADTIKSLCDKAIWIENGRIKKEGSSKEVAAAFESKMFSKMTEKEISTRSEIFDKKVLRCVPEQKALVDQKKLDIFENKVKSLRIGTGCVRILCIQILDSSNDETVSARLNDFVKIRVVYKVFGDDFKDAVLSVGVNNSQGIEILHFNSGSKDFYISEAEKGLTRAIEFTFKNNLTPGEYGITAGIGLLERHPERSDLTVPTKIFDHCVGGAVLKVDVPTIDHESLDSWGMIHIVYEVDKISY